MEIFHTTNGRKDNRVNVPALNWCRRLVEVCTRLLLPEVCASCALSGAWICTECAETVRIADQSQACRRCGHPDGRGQATCSRCCDWLDSTFEVRSVYEFSGALRDSILKMKYRGEYSRADWHGTMMAQLISDLGWTPDILVPVPLHPNRLRQRGYNQSQKLAEAAGKALNLRVVTGLRRNRDTPQQTALGVDERRLNVAGAFNSTMPLAGVRIVLVDDVTTTRATLLECAAACRESGVASVQAVTLATDV
jgi:competence protein ComFC